MVSRIEGTRSVLILCSMMSFQFGIWWPQLENQSHWHLQPQQATNQALWDPGSPIENPRCQLQFFPILVRVTMPTPSTGRNGFNGMVGQWRTGDAGALGHWGIVALWAGMTSYALKCPLPWFPKYLVVAKSGGKSWKLVLFQASLPKVHWGFH